ncbi:MAG: MFS transporter, partial [Cyanobacteria bacterium J06639_1]
MAGKRILWVQVWGLAAIQGAISLTWVIYNLYLPDLLTQFGFAASLAGVLLVIENILAAVMEPLMGSLSDRVQRFVTTSFPFITVGLVAASFFFIAIPGTVTFINPVGLMRGLLLVVLVSWAIAMTIFRSPAMSLLGRYAFSFDYLPSLWLAPVGVALGLLLVGGAGLASAGRSANVPTVTILAR